MNDGKRKVNKQIKVLETKKYLYECAITLFAQKDYDSVSVDEIVEKAGISKGAFYRHYNSKDDIILEQYKKIDTQYIKMYSKIKNEKPTSLERILILIERVCDYTQRNLGLNILKPIYFSQIKKENPFLIEENRTIFIIIQEIISEGQGTGEFRNDISANELTKMLMFCLRGLMVDWCLRNGCFDLAEYGSKFMSIVFCPMLKSEL